MNIRILPGGSRLSETCLCLGNFDGLHLGHRAIVETCLRQASEGGFQSVVWTFARHPDTFFSGHAGDSILSPADKAAILDESGVSILLEEDFQRVRDLSPEAFCREILLKELDARAVVCGFNFRFGKNGAGTAADLEKNLAPAGVRVTVVPPVERGGAPVSSTRIRRALTEGRPEEAAEMLGRPYFIRFPVTVGRRLGRRLGFPTVNQVYPASYVLPRFGVYAVEVETPDGPFDGVCNVGRRPTVEENGAVTAETHLFGFSGDLYGKDVKVSFRAFLRPEKKFAGLEALQEQIEKDKRAAAEALDRLRIGVRT